MSIFYKGKQIAGNEVTLSEVTAQLNQSLEDIEAKRLSSIESLETKKVGSLSEIDEDRENSLNQIDASRQNSLAEIQQLTDENTASFNTLTANSIEELDTLRNNSLSQVESTRDSVVADVAAEGTVQVNLCKDQVNLAKDEVALATAQAELATQKAEEAVGVAIGTYLDIASNQTYIPSGYLLRDGAEYSASQFQGLWDNYLTSNEVEFVSTDVKEIETEKGVYAIAYGNGKYVGVGNTGHGIYSENLIDWTSITIEASRGYSMNAIAYGNGKFVAGAARESLLYSTDGLTWYVGKAQNYDMDTEMNKILYLDNYFVAFSTIGGIFYSQDGITWSERIDANSQIFDAIYVNNRLIIVGDKIQISTDGVNFEEIPESNNWRTTGITYGNGYFVIAGTIKETGNYFIKTSKDGINWETFSNEKKVVELSYGADRFIATAFYRGSEGISYVMLESIDGVNWQEYYSTDSFIRLLGFLNDTLIYTQSQKIFYQSFVKKEKTRLNTCFYSEYNAQVSANGFCDKFAVDAENQKFRAPLANPNNRVLIEKKEPTAENPYWYNLYSDGWCEQGGVTVPSASTANKGVVLAIEYSDTNYQVLIGNEYTASATAVACVVTSTKTTAGFTIADSKTATYYTYWRTQGYTNRIADGSTRPYVVVANGELNQSDMDWSQWATSLEGKVDKGDMIPCATIIEWYENGTEGYVVYSNNYCEQWGKAGRTAASQAITLFKPYRDVNYGIVLQAYHTALSTDGRPPLVYNAETATDGFTINLYTGYAGAYWRTYGFVQG